ncbi:TonB-dependent receptor [Agriterribacter sp.]|uniref:TonB-dependent receptor plug domain-containing protein n=1 Tax=Agriterribacter sp. TaxID=2821509 RepID=UPI002B5A2DFE|nr:TonB-dependent receptor [Agriterribacter sp.]HRO47897.1 TonB-dependent receptor [Agriterribacter sp.]HRQ15926.1 TonB-dependent receptor [Agriterribacter sp.]
MNTISKVLTAISLITISFAHAQEIELDPITVTATLSQKRASETGRNITIIKGERIQNLPVHSLDELLRYVPGVEIQARGPMGSQSDIVLRGGTFQQVLVILDGMRLNDPNTGHFNSYIPIAPSEIERIEILKGASSAIHGADAVGGVIYIITKSFAAKQNQEQTHISAGVSAGEYGFLNTDAGFFYSKNNLSIGGGVLTNNANGVQQRGTKGFFHNTTASVSANYHLNSNWNIAYRTAYDKRDFSAQNFYTPNLSDTATEQVTSLWNQLRIGYHTEKQSLSLNAGFKQVKDDFTYNKASAPNKNISQVFQALLLYQNQLSSKTTLVTGMNFQQKVIRSNDRGNHSLYMASPFVSVSQQIAQHFVVRPSVQLVLFEKIPAEFVPQLDLSYKINNWQIRGSAGKTIRDADFTERYNNYNKPSIPNGQRVGYPGLKAERSFSYEAGADWFLQDKLKISSTFFQRFHQRLIDYSNTEYGDMPRKENLSPAGVYALAKNIATVNTSGFETDIQYLHTLNENQSISASAGFVWLNSKSSDTVPSFYISSHAKFLTNFSLVYQCHNLTASLTGLYKQRQEQSASAIQANITPDYFIMNAKIEYAFFHKSLSVFAQADNIFNRQYSDLLGTPMPGRWLMGGVKWQWKKSL